ncbi:MAG: hypothetical protein SGILL_007182 [Bacillariaceae sp.]
MTVLGVQHVIDNDFVSHNPNEPPSEVNTVVSGSGNNDNGSNAAVTTNPLISPQKHSELEFFTNSFNRTEIEDDIIPEEHLTLRNHPLFWSAVGVSQTFSTAIMFGWASLVPVLRDEAYGYSPTQLSQIFTAGAVGNYLATLPFGVLLDWYGPKATGIVASILYGMGLLLCSRDDNFYCFLFGFGLVGLARPGIQMPTLHLSNLFSSKGSAIYMSAQAAAFDAGTAVFALFHFVYYRYGISSSTQFLVYLVVPIWTLLTAIFVWPNETIEKEVPVSLDDDDSASDDSDSAASGMIGSPYFSPKDRKFLVSSERKRQLLLSRTTQLKSQVNAPLKVVLTHVSFYAMATWVSIHIYKLNYIVATINDQLKRDYDIETANHMIDILGAMLPFGFVVLPIVATMLHTQPMVALQVANVVGFIYGGVITYLPGVYWLQILIIFPAVATSRQLVYSTLFHTIGQIFGFANYGVLLGLTNAIASLFQTLQTPMVDWSENVDSYFWSNWVLWVATVPLFISVLYSDPTWRPCLKKDGRRRSGKSSRRSKRSSRRTAKIDDDNDDDDGVIVNEGTSLLFSAQRGDAENGR